MGWRTAIGRRGLEVLAAGAFAVGSCVVGAGYGFDPAGYLLTLGIAAPLAFCGRYPFTAAVVACAGYAGYLALGHPPSVNWWSPLLTLLVVWESRPGRPAVVALLLTAAVVVQSGIAGGLAPGAVAAQAALAPPGAALIGWWLRRMTDRQTALRLLSQVLAREQDALARRVLVDERIRIARELHDLIAHRMAVISVQAGLAGYVFTSDPAAARQAVETIRGVSHEVLAELRGLTDALRDDPEGGGRTAAPLDALPGLEEVPVLVDRAVRTGSRVQYRRKGGGEPLPPGVELCVYRTVQEALANVARHAPGASTEVLVERTPRRLVVTVRNAGDGERECLPPGGPAGHGLIGLRERARISGGELTAGMTGDGGFEVRLVLPLRPDQPAARGS
ncbi:sensor histidine kinase [Kitasatospora sp. NPDC096147]|uniref:sensor histidine kinase n=1 Tax=Kitasatospora sp. NPDC096147 TaxID=3364093 RepID=UPI0037FCE9A2